MHEKNERELTESMGVLRPDRELERWKGEGCAKRREWRNTVPTPNLPK